VQQKPIEVDFQEILATELTMAMGQPEEISQVTGNLVDYGEKDALIVSDQMPYTEVERAFTLAGQPARPTRSSSSYC
jgi:hypothetical protein